MKILPKHYSLGSVIYWLFGINLILVFLLPYPIAFSFKAHIIFLIFVFLIIFIPGAGRRIPMNSSNLLQKRLFFPKALGLTFLLIFMLILAFYSVSHLTGSTLPIGVQPLALFEATAPVLWQIWGLFPWGIYILLAVGLSYVGYFNNQPADMSTLIRPLAKNTLGDTISLTADVTTKIGLILSLSWTLGLLGMECVSLIHQSLNLPFAYGPRVDLFLLMLVVLQWSKGNFLEDQFAMLLKRRIQPALIILCFLVIGIFSVLLIGILIGWLSPIYTPALSTIFRLSPPDWAAVWVVFSGIWWLSWAPWAGATLAYLWRGYTIRTLIISTLLLPMTLSTLAYCYPNWHLSKSLNGNSLWNLVPALLAIGIMITLFLRTRIIAYVWKATLPADRNYQRNSKFFLMRVLQGVILAVCLYWIGGIYISGLLYFGAILPMGIFVLTAGISSFWIFWRRNK